MQQVHSSIKAIRTKDKIYGVKLEAETRRKELQEIHGNTHFFWIRVNML